MKTQQCCVLVGAVCSLGVGTCLALISKRIMEPDPVLRDVDPQFAPWVLALGLAALASGVLGLVGAGCSSRGLLCAYGVGELLVTVFGLLLGGTLLATVNEHGEEMARSCAVSRHAGQPWSDLTMQYQASYDSMKEALENCRRNGRQNALGLEDCGQLGRDNSGAWFEENTYRNLFEWLESRRGCGGFCTGDLPLFGWSSRADGSTVDQSSKETSLNPCFNALVGELESRGDWSAILVLSLSAPLILAVCGSLWIVCYPPPRARKGYVHPGAPPGGRRQRGESHRLLPGGRAGSSDEDDSGLEEDVDDS